MTKLELLIAALDEGHRELVIALEGLPDGDVWRRPHANLLSVGEIVGHVAYWEGVRLASAPDEGSTISSPLVDRAFRYYTGQVGAPVVLDLDSATLTAEILRVHAEARAALVALNPELGDPFPGPFQSTWRDCLQYMAFHVAYHTGQIYSARHIFGHETEDN
jgi:hypothetical protein